jgi:hypothetical protein
VLLIARPPSVSDRTGKIPDNVLWSSILPNLKGLRIVAQQSLQAQGHYGALTLEQETDCWVKWIRPFLECFSQHLSSRTVAGADYNGREETSKLVNEFLPNGYRKVRCHLASHFFFETDQFSMELGYWNNNSPTNSHHV